MSVIQAIRIENQSQLGEIESNSIRHDQYHDFKFGCISKLVGEALLSAWYIFGYSDCSSGFISFDPSISNMIHWIALKIVFRYLKSTLSYTLRFVGYHVVIEEYSDAK